MPKEVAHLFPEDPERKGILTEGGRTQMRNLGKQFRSWLVDEESFLRPLSCPDMGSNDNGGRSLFEVKSTTYPRTIESAKEFLSGLFDGDTGGCVTDGDIVDSHTILGDLIKSDSEMFRPWDVCNILSMEWNSITHSTSEGAKNRGPTKRDSDLTNPLLKNVRDKLHLPYINGTNILQAFDPLASYKSMHGTYPCDVTEEEYEEVASLLKRSNIDLLFGKEGDLDTVGVLKHKRTSYYLRKLLAFGALNSVLDELIRLQKGERTKSFIYHSSHDLMLLAILSNISLTDGMLPPFASHIEFVVKEIDDDYDDHNDNDSATDNKSSQKPSGLYLAVTFNGKDAPIVAGGRSCEREYTTNNIRDETSSHWCSLSSAIKDIRDEIPDAESGFFETACSLKVDDVAREIELNSDL